MKPIEAAHIAVAVIVITVAFWLIPSIGSAFSPLAILITVGLGFVLHELAHRAVAMQYGAKAQFIAWKWGLALALAMAALVGVVFAAPGATYVWGKKLKPDQVGLMKLAGPATNLVLAALFGTLGHFFLKPDVVSLGAGVNASLALFNLIPFDPLDGGAIFQWNKLAWGAAALFALGAVVAF